MKRTTEGLVVLGSLCGGSAVLGVIAALLPFGLVREVLSIGAAGLGVFAAGVLLLKAAEALAPDDGHGPSGAGGLASR